MAPLWRNLPVGKVFGKVFGTLAGGHRFFTHSLLGVACMWYLATLLLAFIHPIIPSIDTSVVAEAFLIGILSHLAMDTITKEGVPWLLPIPIKFGIPPLKSLRITTGHWVELWVVLPLLIVFNFWLYSSHYQQVLVVLHRL